MALTYTRVSEVVTHAKTVSDEAKALHYRLKEFLTTNSNLSIDWGAVNKPAYINEDVAGNLDGFTFTRQQMANMIGSLDNIRKVLDNEAASQGDHLGNINQIASSDA